MLRLWEEEFVDFSSSRNRLLELAGQETEFLLLINGGDKLVNGTNMRRFLDRRRDFCGPSDEMYLLSVTRNRLNPTGKEGIVRSDNHRPPFPGETGWRFVGVTHEVYYHDAHFESRVQMTHVEAGALDVAESGRRPSAAAS